MRPTYGILAVLTLGLVAGRSPAVWARPAPAERDQVSVQIAILLDTSNSMDGLIAQAKTQLWTVVNEFVKAKHLGRTPRVQVALFEYGNNRLAKEHGYVRLVLPLTDDLDDVSEKLFALTTCGGEEYCGYVIRDAVNRLSWNRSSEVYKAIFIAGNEPFTQGNVDFREACRAAIHQGILVNTIFCGPPAEGEGTAWKDGALLTDGQYMAIEQNQDVVQIAAPQDAEIARLNAELNTTYIPYGKMGQQGQARQVMQDTNALNASASVLASRARSKVGALYCVDGWDLVDAIKTGRCTLDSLKDEQLPELLRKQTPAERKEYVAAKLKRREALQAQIMKLSEERDAFVAKEQAKHQPETEPTLDRAIIEAIRRQASGHQLTFD